MDATTPRAANWFRLYVCLFLIVDIYALLIAFLRCESRGMNKCGINGGCDGIIGCKTLKIVVHDGKFDLWFAGRCEGSQGEVDVDRRNLILHRWEFDFQLENLISGIEIWFLLRESWILLGKFCFKLRKIGFLLRKI